MLEDGEPEMASILGKRLNGLTHSYPSALDEIRDLFDVTIIRDLEEREGSKAPARLELVYALGAREELTADIRRHQMTPSFCSVEELNAFLRASSPAVAGDLHGPGSKWPACGC